MVEHSQDSNVFVDGGRLRCLSLIVGGYNHRRYTGTAACYTSIQRPSYALILWTRWGVLKVFSHILPSPANFSSYSSCQPIAAHSESAIVLASISVPKAPFLINWQRELQHGLFRDMSLNGISSFDLSKCLHWIRLCNPTWLKCLYSKLVVVNRLIKSEITVDALRDRVLHTLVLVPLHHFS